MNINVVFEKVSARRNFPPDRRPEKININTNANFHGFVKGDENRGKLEFTMNVNYNPGVGQMNLSGKAYIQGEDEEMKSVENREGTPFKKVANTVGKSSIVQFCKLAEQVNIPAPLPNIKPSGGGKTEKLEEGFEKMFR